MNSDNPNNGLRPLQRKTFLTSLKNLLDAIIESLSGTERDFTSEPLGKAILLLSVPMVLEMAMESIFAIADIFFVSRLGADKVAVVGITESLMTVVYALGIGLGTAATAVISRRIGEKDPGMASRSAGQAILIGLFISITLAIPSLVLSDRILILMGLEEVIASELGSYTKIILGSNMIIMLLFINNAIFRSSGDAAISMRVLVFANLLNIILDPVLIFGMGIVPPMGIKGAAIATTTGRGLAVMYQFFLLFRGHHRVRMSIQDLVPDWKIIGNLLRLAAGATGQYLIATSSWIFLVRIISIFGSQVVAGYTIAIRVMMFTILPSWGISNASATLVGQNLGAGNMERAERSAWITGYINMVFLGLIGLALALFPESIIGLFIEDPVVVGHGGECLRILSYGYVAYGLGMVMVNSLNGAGDTVTPTWINFFCYFLLEIPLAYLLAVAFGMEAQGVFVAILAAEVAMTASAFVFFKRGRWRTVRV